MSDEWYANAAGCHQLRLPESPSWHPRRCCPPASAAPSTWSPMSPRRDCGQSPSKSGVLRLQSTQIPIPVTSALPSPVSGSAETTFTLECGGGQTQTVEWVTSRRMEEVEDGKVEVFGLDHPDVPQTDSDAASPWPSSWKCRPGHPGRLRAYPGAPDSPSRELRPGRHAYRATQYRLDTASAKQAVEKGFSLRHIGVILHAKFHQDFGAIFDKLPDPDLYRYRAGRRSQRPGRKIYNLRDARVENMTGRNHRDLLFLHPVQVLRPEPRLRRRPERTGLCGSYNWMDCKASFEINPHRPQPARCPRAKPRCASREVEGRQ